MPLGLPPGNAPYKRLDLVFLLIWSELCVVSCLSPILGGRKGLQWKIPAYVQCWQWPIYGNKRANRETDPC